MMNRTARLSIATIDWPLLVMGSLGLWLSGSLVVDLLVVPTLSATGMMSQPGFINAGHLLFSVFNHLELLFAAIVVSGCLCLGQQGFFSGRSQRWSGIAAMGLMAIAVIYTYALTPAITDLGFDMASFNSVGDMPAAMLPLHGIYWGLELVKMLTGLSLLRQCYQDHFQWQATHE